MKNSPVIILGMHRSGTTLISKLLENLGLFVGDKKEINNEALFFWEINNWLFELHTATAEKPYNMRYTNPSCKKIIEESLEYFVQSNKRKQYLGNYSSKYKSIKDIDFPFGWKDPKNTFTLDFWKTIFTNPKIIHIYRNPIDVSLSYIERDLDLKNKFEWNYKKKIKRNLLISHNFHQNFRISNIEDGYKLWEEYVLKANEYKQQNENYLAIKYEDFLEQPLPFLEQLIQFTNLKVTNNQLLDAIKLIKPEKAFSFTKNENYCSIYEQIKETKIMHELGYNNIPY